MTVLNKSPEPLEDFELKAVVPKGQIIKSGGICLDLDHKNSQIILNAGCKVKLQPPSTDNLPAFNPFVPPPAITQVMLIANPKVSTVSEITDLNQIRFQVLPWRQIQR